MLIQLSLLFCMANSKLIVKMKAYEIDSMDFYQDHFKVFINDNETP